MSGAERPNDREAIAADVAALWSGLFGRASVPRDVSFPELGGDSLLLLCMLSSIEQQFGAYLDIEELLDDLTVNGVARLILNARS